MVQTIGPSALASKFAYGQAQTRKLTEFEKASDIRVAPVIVLTGSQGSDRKSSEGIGFSDIDEAEHNNITSASAVKNASIIPFLNKSNHIVNNSNNKSSSK